MSESEQQSTLLTARQVAEMLVVHPATPLRWAREGLIDAVRLPGGTLRFRRADVEAMLAKPEKATA